MKILFAIAMLIGLASCYAEPVAVYPQPGYVYINGTWVDHRYYYHEYDRPYRHEYHSAPHSYHHGR